MGGVVLTDNDLADLVVHCRYCESWRPARRVRLGGAFVMLHMKCATNGEILPELSPVRICCEFYTTDPRSAHYERFRASGWQWSMERLLRYESVESGGEV